MKNSWLSLENGIRKVLNFLLGVPVRIYFEIILVIVLLILGLDLYHEARHQYSPVVQRVHFGDMNIRNSLWIDISAALDDKLDDAFESEVKGNQYVGINIQDVGSVERVNSVPVEVAAMSEKPLLYYTTISVTASGEDWTIKLPVSDSWQRIDDLWTGLTRVSKSYDGHRYLIENYNNDKLGVINFVIRGNNIFNDTDPKNPYVAFYLTFENGKMLVEDGKSGGVSFYYNHFQDTSYGKPFSTPIRIVSVSPEPDYMTPTMMSFGNSFDLILENGLYVIAEDLSKKRNYDVQSFLCSVFLGVVITLFVQVLLSLVHDLSDWLNQRNGRRNIVTH